jgi:hypothetical protein
VQDGDVIVDENFQVSMVLHILLFFNMNERLSNGTQCWFIKVNQQYFALGAVSTDQILACVSDYNNVDK